MFKKVLALLSLIIVFNTKSQIIKSWTIDSFQVNLVRCEQVQETAGIFPLEKSSAYYSLIEIRKHGKLVSMGGYNSPHF